MIIRANPCNPCHPCAISLFVSYPAPGQDQCADREYYRKERRRFRRGFPRRGGRSRRGDGAGILFIEDVGVGDGELDCFAIISFFIIELNHNIYWCITIFPFTIWS